MSEYFQITLKHINEKAELIREALIEEIPIFPPLSVSDFGLNQAAQLRILEKLQTPLMNAQSETLNQRPSACPECQSRVWKNGKAVSAFHQVFSDHQVALQKYQCSNPSCNWSYTPSIKAVLGGSRHSDLSKLQAEFGAVVSFNKSEHILRQTLGEDRAINNHERIRQTAVHIGNLVEKHLDSAASADPVIPAKELIVQVDGGHVHDKDRPKHNFEAMTAKVFRPQNCQKVSKDRFEIVDKNCAASAKKDEQETMKGRTLSAAKAQGLNATTNVTALADGAANCWNIVAFLKTSCASILCILDWFHIAKNLNNLFKKVSCFQKSIQELVKLELWEGRVIQAIALLKEEARRIARQTGSLAFQEDLTKTITYLENNAEFIVNYQQRKEQGLIYTSSIAESTVEHLLNERMKRKQKMQWTRNGCHAILQIRAAMAGDLWESVWQDIEENEIRKTA